MASYDYKCPECGFEEEQIHSMKTQPVFFCPVCKNSGKEVKLERQFSINTTGFIIRGGTESINWKEKRYHQKKSVDLGVRQIDRYGTGPKLKPNVGGVEVESWTDASKLAKEAGMNADSYKPLIEKEKYVSKTSGVDDSKWKKAKEAKNL
jgi:putative FmdB family regulatory protein